MIKKLANCLCAASILLLASPAAAYVSGTPVPTDSRIKTFVYNANDVFRLMTYYGYQMNIEFGEEEEIETVSLGDRAGWQITPGDRRIFIRAMEDDAHTNMTVVTDKHTYQFDLYSSKPGEKGWDELVYVVRFFYPPDQPQYAGQAAPAAAPMMAGYTPPMSAMPYAAPPMMMAPPMMAAPQMLPQSPLMAMPPVSLPAPMMMPAPQASMPQMPPMMPMNGAMPMNGMMMPPLSMPQQPTMPMQSMPSMGMGMPPFQAPPMATPDMMAQPATSVPQVNVNPGPYGMVMPPDMPVGPAPVIPHPKSPFVANQLSPGAQALARQYPQGSYRNSTLAPRRLPSLERSLPPSRYAVPPASPAAPSTQYGYGNSEMEPLPLPSELPGNYMQF